jgi:thiopeptide-type bacteriocin biosynthesis protein
MSERKDWLSVHIFLFDTLASEACLLDDIMPAVRDLIAEGKASGWFFIRYWEGGPHLRLRLANVWPEVGERFLEQLRPKVELRRSDHAMTRESYYGQHAFDGEPVDVAELPWFGDAHIAEIAYEPETVRYGGPAALPLSEELFMASSELAVQIVAATREDPSKRMGAAFALMLATAAAAGTGTGEDIARFCENYASMWEQYSGQTRDVARAPLAAPSPGHLAAVAGVLAGTGLPGAFARRWHEALLDFRDRLERLGKAGSLVSPMDGTAARSPESVGYAILAVLWSQLHMLNNRLAVLPTHELLVARTIAAAARGHLAGEKGAQ